MNTFDRYLLARYFGLRSLATLYGFNWMALGIASAIGPILMGRAFDATGTYSTIFTQLAGVTSPKGIYQPQWIKSAVTMSPPTPPL